MMIHGCGETRIMTPRMHSFTKPFLRYDGTFVFLVEFEAVDYYVCLESAFRLWFLLLAVRLFLVLFFFFGCYEAFSSSSAVGVWGTQGHGLIGKSLEPGILGQSPLFFSSFIPFSLFFRMLVIVRHVARMVNKSRRESCIDSIGAQRGSHLLHGAFLHHLAEVQMNIQEITSDCSVITIL